MFASNLGRERQQNNSKGLSQTILPIEQQAANFPPERQDLGGVPDLCEVVSSLPVFPETPQPLMAKDRRGCILQMWDSFSQMCSCFSCKPARSLWKWRHVSNWKFPPYSKAIFTDGKKNPERKWNLKVKSWAHRPPSVQSPPTHTHTPRLRTREQTWLPDLHPHYVIPY